MTEPQDRRPPEGEGQDPASHASVGEDAAAPGAGRTAGETSVDDALGEGEAPPQ